MQKNAKTSLFFEQDRKLVLDLLGTDEILTRRTCDFIIESYFDKSPLILKLLFLSVAILIIVISSNQFRKSIISSSVFNSDAGGVFPQTFLS